MNQVISYVSGRTACGPSCLLSASLLKSGTTASDEKHQALRTGIMPFLLQITELSSPVVELADVSVQLAGCADAVQDPIAR